MPAGPEFDRVIRGLRSIAADGGAVEMVDALAQVWVDTSRARVPVDTGQTRARTQVVQVGGSGNSASATVVSDTPYAGFIEYGTRYMAPRPYFRQGRDAAVAAGDVLGMRVRDEVRRVVSSGGVWNPRRLF